MVKTSTSFVICDIYVRVCVCICVCVCACVRVCVCDIRVIRWCHINSEKRPVCEWSHFWKIQADIRLDCEETIAQIYCIKVHNTNWMSFSCCLAEYANEYFPNMLIFVIIKKTGGKKLNNLSCNMLIRVFNRIMEIHHIIG